MKIRNAKLVQFTSTDNLQLPGLLFEPSTKTSKVVINLHGNGSASVFYSYDKTNCFAEELNKKKISFFTFNNRGAHYIKKLKIEAEGELEPDDIKLGTTYELIKDCIKDIDGAIDFLKGLGYKDFYLLGHSTGANKICVYNFYKPKNEVKKYVLLGGGDDTGIIHDWVGGTAKLKKYLKQAKEHIDAGNGRKLIPKYILDYMISYEAFYDTCNPDGDYNTFPFNEYVNKLKLSKKPLFREYKSIKKPTFVVYGNDDEYCTGGASKAIEILRKETSHKNLFKFELMENADHGFHGYEEKLAILVSDWLAR